MRIVGLKLTNFRSYAEAEFEFGDKTMILGLNGSGKTNILEAVLLLATGRSLRAQTEKEMLRFDSRVAAVDCRAVVGGEDMNVVVRMIEDAAGRGRKEFLLNGVPRRQIDVVGRLRVVLFSPTDMELVGGSPGERRWYLDLVISQADREYRRCLLAYERGLRQRNRLLEMIREGTADKSQLFFWDRVLIKNGQYIIDERAEFLRMTGFTYNKSEISESRLKQYEAAEVAAGFTLVGPHRDDFVLMTEICKFSRQGEKGGEGVGWGDGPMMVDARKFGSRGEQRMAVWWMKQCEVEYLIKRGGGGGGGEYPVLLLDDIFSELDGVHRRQVIDFMGSYGGQVIVTTAEREARELFAFDKVIEL